MKMEQIECSETSAYINQTPGNHPKENTQQSYNNLTAFRLHRFILHRKRWYDDH